jgi:hypothetical protein
MKLKVFVATLACLAAIGAANAEERLGVTVYPGAKYDADTSKAVKEMTQGETACFTTADPVAKVAAFYRTQGLKAIGDATGEGAMFKKGAVDVTIQSPWMNMKSGAMMKDTLVSIVKQPQ